MTTPDKEEMPTEDRTAGPWRLSLVSDAITQEIWSDTVRPELFATCRGQRARANAAFIVTACNAYEPMREALNLSRDALEQARLYIEGDEETHGRQFGDGNAVRSALAKIDSALSTLPVNDRHHSGSDNERNFENVRDAWKIVWEREAEIARLTKVMKLLAGGFEGEGVEIENEWRISIARAALKGVPQPATRNENCTACGGWGCVDDDPEVRGAKAECWKCGGSGKAQPASEAGKLSTDELAYNHRDEADQ